MSISVSLATIPLFQSLDQNQQQAILTTAQRRYLTTGEMLFVQQQPSAWFYLLESGLIRLYALAANGQEKTVEVIMPGQLFAEAVMFMEFADYPVSAVALQASTVVGFAHQTLRELLAQNPALSLKMLGTISMRLHGLLQETHHLTLHNARYRLVYFLLQQSRLQDTQAIVLPMTKHLLASRLAMTPETLSRILSELKHQEFIAEQETILYIKNPTALAAILEK